MKTFILVFFFALEAVAGVRWPDLSQVAKDYHVHITSVGPSSIQIAKGTRLVRLERLSDYAFKVNGQKIDLLSVKNFADLRAQFKAGLPRKTAQIWMSEAVADDSAPTEDDALIDAMIKCVHMASSQITCDNYVSFVKACLTDAQAILEVPRTQQPQVLYDRLYKMGQQVAAGETAIFHSVSTEQQDADFFHQCSCDQDHHSPCSNDYAGPLVKGYAQCIDDFNKMKDAADLKDDYSRIARMAELFDDMSKANASAQSRLHQPLSSSDGGAPAAH